MKKIITLKNGMNSKRKIFTSKITNFQIIKNSHWFLGFIEGEATFGIKTGSALYFQIAEKNTSPESLNNIITLLMWLPKIVFRKSKILPMNVVSTINKKKTNVVSLVVNSVDNLYYCILPYLETYNMYTHKAIDFKLWKIALLLKIHGYYFLPKGKKLFLYISNIINKRYSSSTTRNTDEIIREI